MLRSLRLLGLTILCLAQAMAADHQPNIVFCMADDLGYGDTAYQGHPIIKTPVLDEMAATGIRLNRFYTVAASCSPTRATTLTGRHYCRTGVYAHSVAINPDEVTIADALRASGYAAGHFGKWHLAGHGSDAQGDSTTLLDPEFAFSPHQLGFEYSFGTVNNSRKTDPGGFVLNGKPVGKLKGESSQIIIDHALEWMDQQRKKRKPFVSYIWFHTPHTPHGSTPEYLKMYEGEKKNQAYYAQVTAMDAAMGTLRDGLKKMKIAENTILVFCSDNGPGNGGRREGPDGIDGNKKTDPPPHLVPAVIEWPGKMKKPLVVDTPIGSCDFYPTFMELAGARPFGPERAIDGESFASLFSKGTFKRQNPILGMGDIVTPDGKVTKGGRDLAAWKASVNADMRIALLRVKELGGKVPAKFLK